MGDEQLESHCDGGFRSFFKIGKKKKDKIEQQIPFEKPTDVEVPVMDTITPDKQDSPLDDRFIVKKGLLLIILNGEFAIEPKRPGIWWDGRLGMEVFEQLGFDIRIYSDKTSSELMTELEKVAKGEVCNLSEIDSLVTIVSSHGAEQEIGTDDKDDKRVKKFVHTISTKDGIVETDRIVRCFDGYNCRALKGKPKLFFIQACRGRMSMSNKLDYIDEGVEVKVGIKTKSVDPQKPILASQPLSSRMSVEDASPCMPPTFKSGDREYYDHTLPAPQPEDMIEVVTTPCYTDCLIMFASPSGKFAWSDSYGEHSLKRLGEQGGWLLMCLYNKLTPKIRNGETFEILQALTEVSLEMAQNYQTEGKRDLRFNELKSVPCLSHMLRTDIYFKPTSS